jgi:hypothetical protein
MLRRNESKEEHVATYYYKGRDSEIFEVNQAQSDKDALKKAQQYSEELGYPVVPLKQVEKPQGKPEPKAK